MRYRRGVVAEIFFFCLLLLLVYAKSMWTCQSTKLPHPCPRDSSLPPRLNPAPVTHTPTTHPYPHDSSLHP